MKGRKAGKTYAKKSFGQNFLIDRNYIDKIIGALDPQPDENVIEIGAGRGALTQGLLESGVNLTAIELERDMIDVLKTDFAGFDHFKLIESDALKIDFRQLKAEAGAATAFKLVANLPYYISTAILQNLIEQREAFSEMILMFQLEVVERITAPVGSRERGFLTVLVEAYLDADKLFEVPPSAFRPAPKVRSAVVRLKPKPRVEVNDEPLFRELLSAAFRQKRKTIYNNLKGFKGAALDLVKLLEQNGIEQNRRAESLELSEWEKLFNSIRDRAG